MMKDEDGYEVRVKVEDLTDAVKVIDTLRKAGYTKIEMGPPRAAMPIHIMKRMAEAYRGRFNKIVLKALLELNAVDKAHAAQVEDIVEKIRGSLGHDLTKFLPHGILSRTVSMIAAGVLAGKYGWVEFDMSQMPRRFWLTEEGVREARSS